VATGDSRSKAQLGSNIIFQEAFLREKTEGIAGSKEEMQTGYNLGGNTGGGGGGESPTIQENGLRSCGGVCACDGRAGRWAEVHPLLSPKVSQNKGSTFEGGD